MSHVDTSSDINTVEWFFGYGGNHLGLKRCLPNLRLVAACEIEEFPIENLLAKMENGWVEEAPIWSDCRTFPWEPFVDRIDLFVASYPCQPFSAAGARKGADDPRHLWPVVLNWILRVRPLCVFAENVEGHVTLGLSTVISDLEEAGYRVEAGIFSASEVGAPHQRKRVFIMAHRKDERFQFWKTERWSISDRSQWSAIRDQPIGQGGVSGEKLADNSSKGLQGDITWLSISKGWEEQGGSISGCRDSGESELAHPNGSRSREDWKSTELRSVGLEQSPGDSRGNRSTQGREVTIWPSRPGQPQFSWEPPRVVANSKHYGLSSCEIRGSIDASVSEQQEGSDNSFNIEGASDIATSESDGMGNASEQGCQGSRGTHDSGWECFGSAESDRGGEDGSLEPQQWQTQPSVGGDSYGTPRGLGHAEMSEPDHAAGGFSSESGGQLDDSRGTEQHGIPSEQWQEDPASWESGYQQLCISCDNRTDELRLLGNGVVPATAELAFRTLWEELTWK